MLPPLFLYTWSQDLRIYSTHGLLHTSIVYQVLEGGLPPECPVLAGETTLYPWFHHATVAGLVALLGITPGDGFAFLNLAALALTLVLMFGVGRRVGGTRVAGVFCATLSVYGLSFFNWAALTRPLWTDTGWSLFRLRNPVVAKKFTNLNSNSLGYLFFALFLYAVSGILTAPDARGERRHQALLLVAVVGAGLFYPISWLALGASGGAVLIALLLREGRAAWPRVLRTAATMSFGAVLVAPYLWSVSAGKDAQMFLLVPDPGFAATKALGWILTMAPLAACAWLVRDTVKSCFRDRPTLAWGLLAPPLMTALMYVVIGTDWNTNEYKFFGASCFSMAVVGGVVMAALLERRPLLCWLALSAMMLPLSADWHGKLLHRVYKKTDPYVVEAPYLKHAHPDDAALHRYIESQVPSNALFIDASLSLPNFARRPLWIAHYDRGADKGSGVVDGWRLSSDIILRTYFAYPPDRFEPRAAAARAIYEGPDPEIPPEALATLTSATAEGPLFVVSRDAATNARLEATGAFRRVFTQGSITLYLLRLAPTP